MKNTNSDQHYQFLQLWSFKNLLNYELALLIEDFHPQDVYSTFSSDSGNVADYYEGSERPGPPHLIPKSRSMPDYMENYAGVFINTTESSCP